MTTQINGVCQKHNCKLERSSGGRYWICPQCAISAEGSRLFCISRKDTARWGLCATPPNERAKSIPQWEAEYRGPLKGKVCTYPYGNEYRGFLRSLPRATVTGACGPWHIYSIDGLEGRWYHDTRFSVSNAECIPPTHVLAIHPKMRRPRWFYQVEEE
jgi:hypothetical protein